MLLSCFILGDPTTEIFTGIPHERNTVKRIILSGRVSYILYALSVIITDIFIYHSESKRQ